MILYKSKNGVIRKVGSEVHKEYAAEMDTFKYILNEVCISMRMNHDNIIRTISYRMDGPNVRMVQEYADGGDLLDVGMVSEDTAIGYTQQILSAVAYMHDQGIVHRDIKPENILLKGGVIKVCDFGLSAEISQKDYEWCGTLEFMAPEMLRKEDYGQEVDCWAVGCVLYELIFGSSPFYDDEQTKIIENILKGSVHFKRPLKEMTLLLVLKLLCKEPIMRLTAKEGLDLMTPKKIVRRSRSVERWTDRNQIPGRAGSIPNIKNLASS